MWLYISLGCAPFGILHENLGKLGIHNKNVLVLYLYGKEDCKFVRSESMSFKDIRANCFCTSLLCMQIDKPRHALSARALNTKMNNDRADGHCYSFAWI